MRGLWTYYGVGLTKLADGLNVGKSRGYLLVWGYTGISGQPVEKVSNFGMLNRYLCCFIYIFALMDFMHLYYNIRTN